MKRTALAACLLALCASLWGADRAVALKQYQEGMRLEQLKYYPAAEAMFKASLETDPSYTPVQYQLGNCRYYQGDKAGALENYNKYLAADSAASPASRQFIEKLRQERLAAKPTPAALDDQVHWMSDRDAKAESKRSGKPILYDFTAAWCGPCKNLAKAVFKVPTHATWINQQFLPVEVVDRQVEQGSNPMGIEFLQKKYKVEGFPTLIASMPDSKDFKSMLGYPGEAGTLQFLEDSLQELNPSAANPASKSWEWHGRPAAIRRIEKGHSMRLEEASFADLPLIHLGPEKKEKVVIGKIQDAKELSGDIQLAMDNQALYVHAKIYQDHPPQNQEEMDALWNGDSVEFWLCGAADKGKKRAWDPQHDDKYFILAPSSKSGSPGFLAGKGSGVKLRSAVEPWGYTLTASIPLTNFADASWQPGKMYRFDCAINKTGKSGKREAKLFWNAESDDAYGAPDMWGLAEFKASDLK